MNKKTMLILLLAAVLLAKPAFAITGDINGDGRVDIADVAIVCSAFGSTPSSPRWIPQADLNGDYRIDVTDIAMVAANYGQHA